MRSGLPQRFSSPLLEIEQDTALLALPASQSLCTELTIDWSWIKGRDVLQRIHTLSLKELRGKTDFIPEGMKLNI